MIFSSCYIDFMLVYMNVSIFLSYAQAAKAKLSVSGSDASQVPGTNIWKVDVSGSPHIYATLTCAANSGHEYLFFRNGMRVFDTERWRGASSVTIPFWVFPTQEQGYKHPGTGGLYTCRARGRSGRLSDVSTGIILTLGKSVVYIYVLIICDRFDTKRHATASLLHTHRRIFKIDTSKDSC